MKRATLDQTSAALGSVSAHLCSSTICGLFKQIAVLSLHASALNQVEDAKQNNRTQHSHTKPNE